MLGVRTHPEQFGDHGVLGRFGREVPLALREKLADRSDHPAAEQAARPARGSQPSLKTFLDTWAEVRIADRLLDAGCVLDVEVPTPSGKSCDLSVHLRGHDCYVHVKRLDNEDPTRRLGISSRLRLLERIKRPFIVRIRWEEDLSDSGCSESSSEHRRSFDTHVGDELTVRVESEANSAAS